jgi:hypothetical protein
LSGKGAVDGNGAGGSLHANPLARSGARIAGPDDRSVAEALTRRDVTERRKRSRGWQRQGGLGWGEREIRRTQPRAIVGSPLTAQLTSHSAAGACQGVASTGCSRLATSRSLGPWAKTPASPRSRYSARSAATRSSSFQCATLDLIYRGARSHGDAVDSADEGERVANSRIPKGSKRVVVSRSTTLAAAQRRSSRGRRFGGPRFS